MYQEHLQFGLGDLAALVLEPAALVPRPVIRSSARPNHVLQQFRSRPTQPRTTVLLARSGPPPRNILPLPDWLGRFLDGDQGGECGSQPGKSENHQEPVRHAGPSASILLAVDLGALNLHGFCSQSTDRGYGTTL